MTLEAVGSSMNDHGGSRARRRALNIIDSINLLLSERLIYHLIRFSQNILAESSVEVKMSLISSLSGYFNEKNETDEKMSLNESLIFFFVRKCVILHVICRQFLHSYFYFIFVQSIKVLL